MIITVEKNLKSEDLIQIKQFLETYNLKMKNVDENNMYVILGDTSVIDSQSVLSLHGVLTCQRLSQPYKLTSRAYHPMNTIVNVKGVEFGGKKQVIIAGPCSVESKEQIETICEVIKDTGCTVLRGGAYKPRTSPYYFQGLGETGLDMLSSAGKKYNIPVISEIVDKSQIKEFVEHVDIIQVGARNMQNFELLKALGKTQKPILLKRSPACTIDEWLMSAEYILLGGNPNVILCERGIRTFEHATRYSLDLSVVGIVKKVSHLPIIIDPSHATGNYNLIESMFLASIASNCDGVMIEVHNDPMKALSDGNQSLKLDKLSNLMKKAKEISKVIDRSI